MEIYWLIRGYDSTELIYEKQVPKECITETQLKRVLQHLTAKAGLDNDEIIGACLKKKTKTSNQLLDVHKGLRQEFHCGENPYFCAVISKSKQ